MQKNVVLKTFMTISEAMQFVRSLKIKNTVYRNPTLEAFNA